MTAACLDDEVLTAWAAGALAADAAAGALAHVTGCPACAAIIADVIGGEAGPVAAVGRFELRRLLGAGGLGVVFDGWDPLLHRPVAVKMIRTLAADADERGRLIDEGRALARLSHPSVVAVHECGQVGDEVYLVMAKVGGVSLDRWLAAGPRHRDERLRVLTEIASGLAAIHRAGLIHRDLKPDNVVVDDDGRAVVIDLGLARAVDAGAGGRSSTAAGTPQYWAPEQAAGQPATAASDQHAWWQLVRDTLPEVAGRRRGRVALARGLDPSPDRRYPSMAAAAEALAAALRPRRWRRGAIVGVGAAAIVALGVVAVARRGDGERAGCRPLGELGDAPRVIATRLTAWGRDPAPVLVELGRRRAAVESLTRDACRDERAGDAAVAERARRSRACAEAVWRQHVSAIDGVVAGADLGRALEDLAVAPPLSLCAGGAVPATPAPPPRERAARVTELEAAVRAIRVDDRRAPAELLAALDALGPAVVAIEHAPLAATWHHDRADLLRRTGAIDAIDAELVRAANLATAAGDDDLRARATLNRLRLAVLLGRAETDALEQEATAAVARMGDPSMTAELAVSVARASVVRGDAPAAVRHLTEALAIYDGLALPAPRRTTTVLQDLGASLQLVGELERAQAMLDRGWALAEASFGADALETIELRGARATNLMYRERPEAAAELDAVAAALARVTTGPSELVMAVEGYRCELALDRAETDRAARACPAAVASGVAIYGDDSPQLVWPLVLAGRHALTTGDARAAALHLERAQAIARLGAPSPMLPALADAYLALAYRRTGDRRAAALARTARQALAPFVDQPPIAALADELARP